MNEQLDNKQIRTEISKWMGELFDKDVLVNDVKRHVAAATKKVVEAQLKGIVITREILRNLFKETESDFQR